MAPQRSIDGEATSAAAAAVEDPPTVRRAHAGPEAALALPLDLTDAMRVVHKAVTKEEGRPETTSRLRLTAIAH